MQFGKSRLKLSASDLANHLGCKHLTSLNRSAALGELSPPVWRDPFLEVLQQRGMEHEAAYLDALREQGCDIDEAASDGQVSGFDATVEAMRRGADVIVQASLERGRWFGRADVLRKQARPSALGAWSYEVVDTKLSRETKAGSILQLCLYSEMVGAVQGITPEFMHVVSPGTDYRPEAFRVDDFLAYHRFIKQSLEAAVDDALEAETYPEPVPLCDICRWWKACDTRRREDDHLSLVAGISRGQRRELAERGVSTLAELAVYPIPLTERPRRGARASYERVREQARVQHMGRERSEPIYELLPREPRRGLMMLPTPSPGDVFFDIEGDAFAMDGGLEYLLGWAVADDDGRVDYRKIWAVNRAEERAAFESFVDSVLAQLERFPEMHVYHFAPYEPSALKRLTGRFGSRQDALDGLLHARVFVDLYAVVKQSLRASVERYSIKDLEPFYGFEREEELRSASLGLHAVERFLELGQTQSITTELRATVERYNRDDCVSTFRLREWLESLRDGLVDSGEEVPRPVLPPREDDAEEPSEVRRVMDQLVDGVSDDPSERTEQEHGRWLLAHMLDWHRRENSAPWWEYFRLVALSDEELLEERVAVAGLEFVAAAGGTDLSPIHRYRFPHQDTDVRETDPLKGGAGEPFGSVASIDTVGRMLEIKKPGAVADLHPSSVFVHRVIPAKEQAASLLRLAKWVVEVDVDGEGPFRAGRDLLLRQPPRRLAPAVPGSPRRREGETALEAARRLALELDRGVLAIQGPPGAGKTYTGARMIVDLVRAGKKVGITGLSHKVIRNLLDATVEAAEEERLLIRCTQKVKGTPAKYEGDPIKEVGSNSAVLDQLTTGEAQLAAGTTWLWAREEFADSVDVLFVDEAGQMSLANALSVAQAGKNLVLLGDPQQLEQPLQATHPDGTELSALQHLLQEKRTIADDAGLFLPETWRLHPSICDFTSEAFYEGRLGARPDLEGQALIGEIPFAGAGLWHVPVEHAGNSSVSSEESERVAELWRLLVSGTARWRDRRGIVRPLSAEDVLVVAPYNAHVTSIGELLPYARVGTVDKFQGQEAPVVICSLATSTPEDAPRGMEFLFSLNRLNVATSRARCACILVASPRLFEPECRTPRQMQLANGFCRYLELAETLRESHSC